MKKKGLGCSLKLHLVVIFSRFLHWEECSHSEFMSPFLWQELGYHHCHCQFHNLGDQISNCRCAGPLLWHSFLSSEGHSLPSPTESPIKSCKLSSPWTFIWQSEKERTVLGNLLGHFYDKVKLSFKVQNCPSIPSKAPSFPHHLQNDSKMFLDWEFPRLKWGLIHLSLSLSLPGKHHLTDSQ